MHVLELKIVAHHGRFPRQPVGGRRQVAGPDVILAHRLLKNRLPGQSAYLLLTEAALGWIGLDPALEGLAAHTERYPHLGDVRCYVRHLERRAGHRQPHPGLTLGASAA